MGISNLGQKWENSNSWIETVSRITLNFDIPEKFLGWWSLTEKMTVIFRALVDKFKFFLRFQQNVVLSTTSILSYHPNTFRRQGSWVQQLRDPSFISWYNSPLDFHLSVFTQLGLSHSAYRRRWESFFRDLFYISLWWKYKHYNLINPL